MTSSIVPNLTEIPTERSSQIGGLGYDPTTSLLYVQFRRGGLYVYDQVTSTEYAALQQAQSLGSSFAKTIKGVKPYRRLDQQQVGKVELELTGTASATSMPAPARSRKAAAPKPSTALASRSVKGGNLLSMPTNLEGKTVADDLATAAQEWATKAASTEIVDVRTHEYAQHMLLDIDTVRKRIIETWKPMKAAAFAAHRAVCDKESELLKPLNAADQALRVRIGSYTYQQLRLAQEVDQKNRLAAEEEARQRSIRESEENALSAAEELIAMGDYEAADAVLEAPQPAPIRYDMPMPVQPAVAAVAGVAGGIAYEVTINDLALIPREYLVIDMVKTQAEIARRAKQAQGRLQVPGATIRETFATRRTGRAGGR